MASGQGWRRGVDTLRIHDLQRISDCWMQAADEAEAQRLLLEAILEAACLLEGEPSEIEISEGEDA